MRIFIFVLKLYTMISTVFIQTVANILGDSNCGLTTARIVEMCAAYAADYGVDIPYHSSPLPVGAVPNKRTALKENLECFRLNNSIE